MQTSHYPEGSNTKFAPWNQPCTDQAEGWVIEQVTGEDIELTTETLGEFLATVDGDREPLLVKNSALRGPISSGDLLKLMLSRGGSDEVIAAATRELTARYLADPYTRKVIDAEMDRAMGEVA